MIIKGKVLFVGDEPSRLNSDPLVAFVGTPSHKNLLKWIEKMDIKDYSMNNSHTQLHLDHIHYFWLSGHRIVALGNKAAQRLDSMGIGYHKLPHPSPRNRLLNNKNFIDSELNKCYVYLKGSK